MSGSESKGKDGEGIYGKTEGMKCGERGGERERKRGKRRGRKL